MTYLSNCGKRIASNPVLKNPAKWKKGHKCSQKEPAGVPKTFAGVVTGVLPQNSFLLLGRLCNTTNETMIATN
jgi:hypothetical protein